MARSDDYIIEYQVKGGMFVPGGASPHEAPAILHAQQMLQTNRAITGARVKQRGGSVAWSG